MILAELHSPLKKSTMAAYMVILVHVLTRLPVGISL